jgi:hypothetical protein
MADAVVDSSLVLELATEVFKGKFTLEYAKQVAATPEFYGKLSYPLVYTTCELVERGLSKNWRTSVMVMRVLYAALDARAKSGAEGQLELELTTVETWLTVVRVACSDVPDGRLFRDAAARGDALAEREVGKTPPAMILHRLGVLYLDTYVAGRSSANLENQMEAWVDRLFEEYGQDELAGLTQAELMMPPVDEALNQALIYFRRAAARRTGTARGQTLKAIAEAQLWLRLFEVPFDVKELLAAAREALTLLPADQFPSETAELGKMVQRFLEDGGAAKAEDDPAAAKATLEAAWAVMMRPVEEWVAEQGRAATIDIFSQSAGAVADADPDLALHLWMQIDGIIREEQESVRMAHDEALVGYAVRAMAPDGPKADGSSLQPVLMQLFQTAKAEDWEQPRMAYMLLGLAASTTVTKQHSEGLEALVFCGGLMRNGASDAVLDRAVPCLTAVLQTGRAENAADAGELGSAARLYLDALTGNLRANQPLAALDIVRRMVDLAKQSGAEQQAVLDVLVVALTANALELELAVGEAATGLIQTASRFAMARLLATSATKATTVLLLMDAAKGRRFRSALATPGGAIAWLNDPRTLAKEQEISKLRAQVGVETSGTSAAFSQNIVLTAYVSPKEMRGGGTAAEQLRNLQIRFDRALDRRLASDDPGTWIPDLESLQAKLDEKTVLVMEYIGTHATGALTVTTLLVTKDGVGSAIAMVPDVPFADVSKESGEETIVSNILGDAVSELRDRIVIPPGPFAADSRALESLEGDHKMYLGGPLAPQLAEFRAQGKDHLCFVPHGPLHYFPFHLLGPEDEPVAGDWCVTYLPHPFLLGREVKEVEGLTELTSIGVNFALGNAFHLRPLDGCEGEAGTIAASFPGAKVLVGPDANEAAVLAALGSSRRVHISTHGLHTANAPAFQCVFLNAGAGGDGILNAYELLRLDLSTLDLVTFSACETALGRFDPADNLRGIPAALLVAGVSTIVGTLWNVETQTSTFFFTGFYRWLKETGSKKTAFQRAQAETRGKFPKYRDWGAFQLIGAW